MFLVGDFNRRLWLVGNFVLKYEKSLASFAVRSEDDDIIF